ncbi:MAG TPA: MOSC domain-containing protein, partial [Propionibacteriaceae bacterium]|nr:MOSC domain-containing protein [Propionibacteriaceae bacterium]
APRIPCATFRGWMGEKGWAKIFTAAGRPGAYLSVITPGPIRGGDPIEVIQRPDHDVSIGLVFRATTTERSLLPRLLAAEGYLDQDTIDMVRRREVFLLD